MKDYKEEIDAHIHMLGCQALTRAHNLGFLERKNKVGLENSELLDMVEKHEKLLSKVIKKYVDKEKIKAYKVGFIEGEISVFKKGGRYI